jgi:phosphoribosylaminoimidazole carboxylase PurE protein
MKEAGSIFRIFDVPYELRVISAHRTPEAAADYSKKAEGRGIKLIIAGAGAAAHLAGVLASGTTLPVIGVPIASTALNGMDALLSTVQMPGGVPVATMGIGISGARNAALFAVRMLALKDQTLGKQLSDYKKAQRQKVEEADQRVREEE